MNDELRERFCKYIMPEPNSGCFLWIGTLSEGYGQLNEGGKRGARGKMIFAHRLAWQFEHGLIPKGMCVLHKCDVRCCVNPSHLFLGTHTDNRRDCLKKGRANLPRGERHHNHKLTYSDVLAIRSSNLTQRNLAELYSVSARTISDIVQRTRWKWLV